MTDLEILRAALRAYQDAATDALCLYEPGDPQGGKAFGRYLAISRIADEIQRMVAACYRRDARGDRMPLARGIVWSALASSVLREDVTRAVLDDLYLRLCGEPGQIPECLR